MKRRVDAAADISDDMTVIVGDKSVIVSFTLISMIIDRASRLMLTVMMWRMIKRVMMIMMLMRLTIKRCRKRRGITRKSVKM